MDCRVFEHEPRMTGKADVNLLQLPILLLFLHRSSNPNELRTPLRIESGIVAVSIGIGWPEVLMLTQVAILAPVPHAVMRCK
jgi:hypothetical protein